MDTIQFTEDEKTILKSIAKRLEGRIVTIVHIINKIVMIKYITLTSMEEKVLLDIANKLPGFDLDGDLYFIDFKDIDITGDTGRISYAGNVSGRF